MITQGLFILLFTTTYPPIDLLFPSLAPMEVLRQNTAP